MAIVKTVAIFAIIFCLILPSEEFWRRRRRRRSERRRRRFWRRVGRFFRRVGRAIVRVAKTFVKYVKKGIDILKHGCCGLHPSYCANRAEFQRRQREVKAKSALMDKDWAYVKKLKAEVETCNLLNQEVFRNVRRVTLSSTLNMQTLDPKLLAKMNDVSNTLKKQIKAKNRTVLNYGINQIGDEYKKTEDASKQQLKDMTMVGGLALGGHVISMAADFFKLLKLDGVANFLVNEVGGFLLKIQAGISKLFGFDYLKKMLSGSAAGRAVLKVLDFFNKYLNISTFIFRVFEFFGKLAAWITDLATCNKRKREMETNLRDLKKKQADINKSYNDLQVQKRKVTSSWNTVFGQAKSDGLLTNLLEVQKIAQHASGSSANMRVANTKISNYRANIASSRSEHVARLQRELLDAVKKVTFNSDCLQRKMQVLQAVSSACKLGKASMKDLFDQAVEDFRANSEVCKTETGMGYTTFADVKKFVTVQAKRLVYDPDCLMNSGIKRSLVCNLLSQGFNLAYAAGEAEVSLEMAAIYRSECPIPKITPMEEQSICFMKDFKTESQIVNTFIYHQPVKVKNVYRQCSRLFPEAA